MTTFLKIIALLLLAGLVTVGAPCGGLLVLAGFGNANMMFWGVFLLVIAAGASWGIVTIARSFGKAPSERDKPTDPTA